MGYEAYRGILTDYYWNHANERAIAFREKVWAMLDAACVPEMNGYERKTLQYRTIARECEPLLLRDCPFYYETGTLGALDDGCGRAGIPHAGCWNYERSYHVFADRDPELWALRQRQGRNNLYLICGPYCDTRQHFIFNCKEIFRGGLRSIYESARKKLAAAEGETKEFLTAACEGLLALRTISEKFSAAAAKALETETDEAKRKNLLRIRDAAAETPWNAPRTFYEALNVLAFTRTVCGAVEGVGYNTMGRPDVELLPFYEADIASGTLTKEEAQDLVARFLLIWDCHYSHDMKMVGYADHELENTYTLGGCDAAGKPVWNDVTRMFLRATREEKIIFPKITVRFSADSPKEYLDEADEDVIHGTSVILYQNDDATIPALVRCGRSLEHARDYLVTGCWSLVTNGDIMSDHGNYVNLLKPFEFAIHDRRDKMEEVGLEFQLYDDAKCFEDVYSITVENARTLLRERNRMTLRGKPFWPEVDPLPMTSSTMTGCIEKGRDLTNGGCRYTDEDYLLVGFPNVIDSLAVMKRLCFDEKVCSLRELLRAVRANWEGFEDLRLKAIACPGWGQEDPEILSLARRFHHDLYGIAQSLTALWEGGKIQIGHLTYTEIRFWAEKTLATPDGRRNGEYFSQGLTPSRLKKIDSVTSVIHDFAALDRTEIGSSNVLNLILPSDGMTLDLCEAFLRGAAGSALMCLQLNCTTKKDLLDAQKHPEKYPNLIVRVCGFSARFTALSPEWQAEVLSRNFYK